MATYRTVRSETLKEVARITLDRPESLNAFDFAMGEELLDALEACERDEEARAVILTGAGKAFCSGGDIRSMQAFLEKGDAPPTVFFQGLTRFLHAIVTEMQRMPKPIVGAINGVAAGAGFSLTMACDLRIAAETARFTQAYTRIGLVPDGGSTYLLPRLVGPGRAAELIFLNPVITASEAMQWGLISRVVPERSLEQEALEMASQLARGPTRAYARAKRLLAKTWHMPIEAQMEEERRAMAESALTEDFREGIDAFLGKRPPHFKGK